MKVPAIVKRTPVTLGCNTHERCLKVYCQSKDWRKRIVIILL